MITMHTNSKHQYNKEGERHGYWIIFWPDGKLNYTESYVNGQRLGYCNNVHYTDATHNLIDEEEQGYVAK